MKLRKQKDGMWWAWDEFCDRCYKRIHGHEVKYSCEPDMNKIDFCVECLRYLLDNKISYETAKQQYKQSN